MLVHGNVSKLTSCGMKFHLIFVILNIILSTEKHSTERRKRERGSYAYVLVIKCMSKMHSFCIITNTDMIGSFDTKKVSIGL